MGKAANQAAWAEFERLDRQKDEAVEAMSEAEKAADWDSEHWARIQAEVEFFRSGR